MNQDAITEIKKTAPGKQRRRFIPWIVFGLILVVYLCYLAKFFSPAIADPDANGYFTQGRLLFSTGRTSFKTEIDVQFVGLHWLVTEGNTYFCRYPAGFSILVGLIQTVFGHKAAPLTNIILAGLILAGLFLILRREFGWGFASTGMILLAVNPVFNSHALQGFAHIAVMCFLTWGIYFLFRWRDSQKLQDVVIAGLLFGCIPVIRYAEALFALGVGVFLLWEVLKRKEAWKHVLVCCGVAFLPVAMLLIRNQLEFGAFWRTAYDLTNEQTGFGWNYFANHFVAYIRDFQNRGLGLFFGFGLVGMVMMCFRAKTRQKGFFYILLIVPSTLLYMAYYFPRGEGYSDMRFLVPVFGCFIISGIWFLKELTRDLKKWQRIFLTGLIILTQFVWAEYGIGKRDLSLAHKRKTLALITKELVQATEKGDVVISSPGILQQLDYIGKWKLVDLVKVLAKVNRYRKEDIKKKEDDSPSIGQSAKTEKFIEAFEGQGDVEREIVVADQIQNWAGKRNVFFVGDPKKLEKMPGMYFHSAAFEIVKRIPLPEYKGPKLKGRGPKQKVKDSKEKEGNVSGKDKTLALKASSAKQAKGRESHPGAEMNMKEVVIARWHYREQSKRHHRIDKLLKNMINK